MFMFTARYRGQVQSILLHKEMKVPEFLDALSYSLQLPDGQIVGFQDRNGLIITPSFVCHNSQDLRNETYDVMLKNGPTQATSSLIAGGNQATQQIYREQSQLPNQSALLYSGNTSGLLLMDNNHNQAPHLLQQPIVQNFQNTPSTFQSATRATQIGNLMGGGAEPNSLFSNGFLRPPGASTSNNNNDRTLLMGSGSAPLIESGVGFTQPANSTAALEEEIILFVRSFPSDPLLTDSVKNKIISKVRQRDSGIIGAYHLYLVDGDAEGFKARIIHRALTPPLVASGGNLTAGDLYCSSATTAQVNWTNSRTSTAGGGFRPVTRENSRIRNINLQTSLLSHNQQNANQIPTGSMPATQDRYLPVILELEQKGLLNDEQSASLLKTLVLEENFEVYRVINSYLAKAISDRELSFRLVRLAQQLSTYIERPQSPLPRKKNQLLQYVNSLARFHFTDPDDVQLLNKLIQEENEFILSCFDVFESDKDHDNLIDSLKRILEKSKQMGLHRNSMTASSFYNPNPWNRIPQSHSGGGAGSGLYHHQQVLQSHSQTSLRYQQPYISKWDTSSIPQAPQTSQFNSNSLLLQSMAMAGQPHFANQSQIPRSTERPHGAVGGRRQNNATPAQLNNNSQSLRSSQQQLGNGIQHQQQQPPPPHQFQNTTVHNVALIPNYFSSGEEEAAAVQSQQLRQGTRAAPNLGGGGSQSSANYYFSKPVESNFIIGGGGGNQEEFDEDFPPQHHQLLGHGGDVIGDQRVDDEDDDSARSSSSQRRPNGGLSRQYQRLDDFGEEVSSRDNSKQSSQVIRQGVERNQHHSRQGGKTPTQQAKVPKKSQKIQPATSESDNLAENVKGKQRGQNARDQLRQTAAMAQNSSHKTSTNKKSTINSRMQSDRITKGHQERGTSSHKMIKQVEDGAKRVGGRQPKKMRKRSSSSSESSNYESSQREESSESSEILRKKSKKGKSQSKKKVKKNRHRNSSSQSDDDYGSSSDRQRTSSSSSDSSISSRERKLQKKQRAQSRNNRGGTGSNFKNQRSNQNEHQLPSHEQILKVIKREKLEKHLSSFSFAMLLYLSFQVKDHSLLSKVGDLLRRETDSDFFVTYAQGRANDAFTHLMRVTYSFQDQWITLFNNHLFKDNTSKPAKKANKAFQKYTDKLLRQTASKDHSKKSLAHILDKLMRKIKKVLQKLAAKKEQEVTTPSQYTERLVKNEEDGHKFTGSLRQPLTFNQQQIESNFHMIYYGEFLTKEKEEGALVKKLYSEKNQDFLILLSKYTKPSDYEELKTGIYALIYQMPQYKQQRPPAFSARDKQQATFPPKTVLEAIELLERDGVLTEQDGEKLRDLHSQNNKNLKSAFDCYLAIKDFDDLADSLHVLCGHKRGTRKQSSKQNSQSSANPHSAPGAVKKNSVAPPNVQDYSAKISSQTPANNATSQLTGMGKISLMNFGGLGGGAASVSYSPPNIPPYEQPFISTVGHEGEKQQRKYSCSGPQSSAMGGRKQSSSEEDHNHLRAPHSSCYPEDENLEIHDNPDESGGDTNEEDITSIIEYQHKILRKYTLSGLIRYYDASFFHDMVSKRDYKMISIFEVFAVNRNEEDFLENLFIFKEIVNEEQAAAAQTNDTHQQQKPQLLTQSHQVSNTPEYQERLVIVQVISKFRDQSKVTSEEFQWIQQQIMQMPQQSKNIVQIIDCWKITKDDGDLVHSLKTVYRRHKQLEGLK